MLDFRLLNKQMPRRMMHVNSTKRGSEIGSPDCAKKKHSNSSHNYKVTFCKRQAVISCSRTCVPLKAFKFQSNHNLSPWPPQTWQIWFSVRNKVNSPLETIIENFSSHSLHDDICSFPTCKFLDLKINAWLVLYCYVQDPYTSLLLSDRGVSLKRNCVLHQWESKTLKQIINHKVDKVN